jgi:hypothetical protein
LVDGFSDFSLPTVIRELCTEFLHAGSGPIHGPSRSLMIVTNG